MATAWIQSVRDDSKTAGVVGIEYDSFNYDYIFDTDVNSLGGYTFKAGENCKLGMTFTNTSGYALTNAKIRIIFTSGEVNDQYGSTISVLTMFPTGSEGHEEGSWTGPELYIEVNGTCRYRDGHDGLFKTNADYVQKEYSESGFRELVINLGTVATGAVVSMVIYNNVFDSDTDIWFSSIMLEGSYTDSHSITLSHTPPAVGQAKMLYNGQFNSSTGQLPALTTVGASFAYPQDAQGLFFVESYS